MTNSLPKILITGSQGQVGTALQNCDDAKAFTLITLPRAQLDITNKSVIDAIINENKPDIIVNTAAYTAVDKAESNQSAAYAANHLGAEELAKRCQHYSIPLIHLSTDYIFNGKHATPYQENDEAQPINIYGHSKWCGEEAIREHLKEHIILRISGVFSAYGNNFLKTMLRLGVEREELSIVSDQTICPTYAGHIAQVIFHIAKQLSYWGTYHYCDGPATSWYDFAREIFAEAINWQSLRVNTLHAITTNDYPTPARRPAYSVLDCTKIQRDFGVAPFNWRDGIKSSLNTLHNQKVIST